MKPLIDLHVHTISSGHAYSTVKENIDEAIEVGLKYLGISDHAPELPGGPHPFFFHNVHVIPEEVKGLRVLKGIEANIMDYEGNLDITDDLVYHMDYVIASLHSPCINHGCLEENTNAVLGAMDHPKVRIIGHLDDSRYPVDYEKVIKKAKEKNILLEINNSSLKKNSFREGAWDNLSVLLKICKEQQVKVIMGTDSHICYSIGKFDNCIELIKRENFPQELVINYNEDDIKEFFNL